MYCIQCGQENQENAMYCMRCGSRLEKPMQFVSIEDEPTISIQKSKKSWFKTILISSLIFMSGFVCHMVMDYSKQLEIERIREEERLAEKQRLEQVKREQAKKEEIENLKQEWKRNEKKKRELDRIQKEKNMVEIILPNLLDNFLHAYVNDMNQYEYKEMIPFVDSTVSKDDLYSIYHQMNKQVHCEFDNIISEELLTYHINKIEKQSSSLYLLMVYEKYNVVESISYGKLCEMGKYGGVLDKAIGTQALEMLTTEEKDSLYSDYPLSIGKILQQIVVYEVKLCSDGKWRFYRYHKPIDFTTHMPEVYMVRF